MGELPVYILQNTRPLLYVETLLPQSGSRQIILKFVLKMQK